MPMTTAGRQYSSVPGLIYAGHFQLRPLDMIDSKKLCCLPSENYTHPLANATPPGPAQQDELNGHESGEEDEENVVDEGAVDVRMTPDYIVITLQVREDGQHGFDAALFAMRGRGSFFDTNELTNALAALQDQR